MSGWFGPSVHMRVRIGDIIEIRTSRGLAYAIYTHCQAAPPKYGAMLRVFEGFYKSRPQDLPALSVRPIQFTTFFPLQAAVSRRLVDAIGNVSVPEPLKPFPLFRCGASMDSTTQKVKTWWLWDGTSEWRVAALSADQRKLPIRGIWNYAYLVSRIEQGWRPETDPR